MQENCRSLLWVHGKGPVRAAYALYAPLIVGIAVFTDLDSLLLLPLVCRSIQLALLECSSELPSSSPAHIAEECLRRFSLVRDIRLPRQHFRLGIPGVSRMLMCAQFSTINSHDHLDGTFRNNPPQCPFCPSCSLKQRRVSWEAAAGHMRCSECGFRITQRWGRELQEGDHVVLHRNLGGRPHAPVLVRVTALVHSRPGKTGTPKLSITGKVVLAAEGGGVGSTIQDIISKHSAQGLSVAHLEEVRYSLCDVDEDGYLTLLHESTGELRHDLKLSACGSWNASNLMCATRPVVPITTHSGSREDRRWLQNTVECLQRGLWSSEFEVAVLRVRRCVPLCCVPMDDSDRTDQFPEQPISIRCSDPKVATGRE